MDTAAYPEWTEPIEELAAASGTVIVVGAVDTGKSTFCTLLAARAHRAGKSVAVIDADIGQSEIGPPTCVGAGRVAAEPQALSDIRPERIAFVGATSPRGRMVEHATAVRLLADALQVDAPDLLIVDTTGYIEEWAALRLKQAKIDMLRPSHVVALQRGSECEPLVRSLRFSRTTRVLSLPVAAVITRKSAALRIQRRMGRLARYFADAPTQTLNLEAVALTGTWLGSGTPVEPRLRLYLERTLRRPVLHAEITGRHLGVALEGSQAPDADLEPISQDLHVRAVTLTPATRYRRLVVGLTDGDGATLGIGLIDEIDFRRLQVRVVTPVRVQASVRGLRFGLLRAQPDGRELGALKPGEF